MLINNDTIFGQRYLFDLLFEKESQASFIAPFKEDETVHDMLQYVKDSTDEEKAKSLTAS